MDPTAQLIAVAISIIAAFGAFGAWIVRHMDRRFAEAKADTQRQFGEMQRQFDELGADMQRGFDQAREDRLRLERTMEDKFDAQGDQIGNLRQDVGRLQGIVERTYQPRRFTVLPAQQEVGAGDEVREPRMGYDAGYGGEDLGHGRESSEYGGEASEHGREDPEHGRGDSEYGSEGSRHGSEDSEYGDEDSRHGGQNAGRDDES